ncbi:DUF2339 domain-containing protein [Dokdonella soli]|uniref:DUF2339 domain-containing protein n=1 Tax=Dokdonella soli TaxID=529810 RepID=A0ABP3TVR9_9GAMM
MAFLIVIASCIVGLVVGSVVGNDATAALGFLGGFAIGLVLVRQRSLSARIDVLRNELDAFKRAPRVPAPAATLARATDAHPEHAEAPAPDVAAAPAIAPRAVIDQPVIDATAHAATPPPVPPQGTSPSATVGGTREPLEPGPVEKVAAWLKRWFTEGNVPVKVGMLVLFAGIAALLKYASDEGWLRLPVEFRLAGIGLAAIGSLAFGWRERARRRSFGLALQGGAIGVLVLTVFAAFRLYQLLPAGAAFALLLVLVAGAGVLAVLQDALALAVLGILAGFAAPILISTGSGNHVVLFSYYALLNLAIFAIAWRKPWRALNLLGFFSTYAIGTAWGVLRYENALFASTEPFLLIWFAIYLAIPILYARRQAPQTRDLVDGTLVFGNPLVAFALQAALLSGERMPLAYSALALAAVYAALAGWLMPRLRTLGESFAVLAVGFATLAVPLALSARVTASTFALEGAALVWLGLRQQRRLPRISGLVLQALAAGAFAFALAFGSAGGGMTPIANSLCISALLIAAAAFVCAWLYWRDGARPQLALLLYLWGLAWWLGAGLREIDHFVPTSLQTQALLAFAALTAALAGFAFLRVRAGAPAWTAAIALAFGIVVSLMFANAGARPFAGWGLAAFAAYAAAGFFALRALRDEPGNTPVVAQIGWLWTWTLALAVAMRQFAGDAQLAIGWHDAATLLPLLAAWTITLLRPAWIAPPLEMRFAGHRGLLLASQALVAIIAFASLLLHDGASAPLPFVPVLNPVDLAQIGVLALAARWLADRDTATDLAARRATLLAVAGFAFVTAATLRTTHQLGHVPWDASLWSSNLAQTALTVVWSVLGVLGWVQGSRRGNRMLWLAGAVLMGVVLAKLLLVDRTHLGNLFGIASFIAYGLLCTVIGYFAPAPPRAPVNGAVP